MLSQGGGRGGRGIGFPEEGVSRSLLVVLGDADGVALRLGEGAVVPVLRTCCDSYETLMRGIHYAGSVLEGKVKSI